MIRVIKGIQKHHHNIQELRDFNDRELSDLGLSRVDIEKTSPDSLFRDSALIDRWRN
ncbi:MULTISPECIES: DUF1127 domain-containing protein [unclassified Oceanispirochaeta]|uniref:DUF1127 domain-containing protein n=1 Tax=unclassified Oceanispirochaeta TaxID=2635722 RepID=UPI000E09C9F4|nr:DUF1127 domain-containing protein [Oceanispirochaeta sp. M2]NPD75217.1 DUF1127 domain-containing protein [Oceanispirochaeta sp. M1]RDG28934.1 DUF1127 domain-containing protein [Oceanispirochaeta sp. M1]